MSEHANWVGIARLRCPRRVQRRNELVESPSNLPFRPLNADGDAAAQRLYRASQYLNLSTR